MASSSFVLKSTGALVLSAFLTAPAHAAGSIEVKFDQPQRFSDVGRSAFDRERTLKSLADYLQSLAPQLPNGQTLRIDVLDVDLAGELEPNWRRSGQEVRVLRGRADAPHIRLRYSLQADGQTLKSGDANLADLSYFFGTPPRESQFGDLPFEKRMLQQWFVNTLNNPSAR